MRDVLGLGFYAGIGRTAERHPPTADRYARARANVAREPDSLTGA